MITTSKYKKFVLVDDSIRVELFDESGKKVGSFGKEGDNKYVFWQGGNKYVLNADEVEAVYHFIKRLNRYGLTFLKL